jgi:hypothetical protein
MHPIITHDLVKAHTSDLHRQAGRDALSRAARRARQAPAKQSTLFLLAHATAELIRRVLTLLGARKPPPASPAGQVPRPEVRSSP